MMLAQSLGEREEAGEDVEGSDRTTSVLREDEEEKPSSLFLFCLYHPPTF